MEDKLEEEVNAKAKKSQGAWELVPDYIYIVGFCLQSPRLYSAIIATPTHERFLHS